MTTLTLQIENPSILAHLTEVLKALNGVKIVDSSSVTASAVQDKADDAPNQVTLSAMKEAMDGNDAGIVSVDSLDSFISSML